MLEHLINIVLVLVAKRHRHFFKYGDSYAESAAIISESLSSNKHSRLSLLGSICTSTFWIHILGLTSEV